MALKTIAFNTMKTLKSFFLTGLIFLLPIAITFGILNLFFNLIKSWLEPIKQLHIPLVTAIPHHEILLFGIFLLLLGLVSQLFIIRPLIHFFEHVFSKIPMLGTIYYGVKQIIHALTAKDEVSFKKVVFVQFPRPGAFSVGFLTSQVPVEMAPAKDQPYFNIYIPNTPNPATGHFVMVTEDKFVVTDLTKQEATALIISGGILQPDRFKKE